MRYPFQSTGRPISHRNGILVPRATILLTCGRDRELWLCPTPEDRDSRTYRQIWQIWLAENMKRLLCTCSENRFRPELSISAAGQKDRGSGDENDRNGWSFRVYMIPLRDFVPEWNSRPGARTGVNSRRGDSRRHNILWWYHVNKYKAMRGNRSELAPGRKSPRCHVNTPKVNYS